MEKLDRIKTRERLQELCQIDLLKKMYDYRPEGVHVHGLNLSAQGYWAMTVTQTILPNINLILRLLHKHWDVFTPAEQRLLMEYEVNVRSFEKDWKAGNHAPRCIVVPKGMEVMLGKRIILLSKDIQQLTRESLRISFPTLGVFWQSPVRETGP